MSGTEADNQNSTGNHGTALIDAVKNSNESEAKRLIHAGVNVNEIDDQGKPALIYAAEKINTELVLRLIEAGADVNITDNDGKTALFYASNNNNMSMVCALIQAGSIDAKEALFSAVRHGKKETLIKAGVAVDECDHVGKNALFLAVSFCNDVIVRALVEDCKAFVNARDLYGRTPLFYAITKSRDLASYLIENGGKVNLKDFGNRSVLSFFIEDYMITKNQGNISSLMSVISEELNLLKKSETDVQLKSVVKTILNIAFCKLPLTCCFGRIEIPQPFEVADVKKIHKNLFLALTVARTYFAETCSEKESTIQRILDIFKEEKTSALGVCKALDLLIELGANPNFADSDGNTALHHTAYLARLSVSKEGIISILDRLTTNGLMLNTRNHLNQTPLLFCLTGSIRHLEENDKLSAIKNLLAVCTFLVKYGSNIDETSRSEESVFHLIIKLFRQGLEIFDETRKKEFLVEVKNLLQLFSPERVKKRETVNKRDSHLNSPLHLWASLELTSPQEYIINDSFEDTLKTILNHLLKLGASINPRNECDETPLHLCKTWIAAKLLMEAGANPNDLDSSKRSPLVVAAKTISSLKNSDSLYPDISDKKATKSKNVIQAFIKFGADVNKTDKDGQTALFYAVQQSKNEYVVQALIESGGDVNITNSDGQTALFYAVHQSNNENVVQALIDGGAEVNKIDKEDQTALLYAVQQSNNESVVRALIDAGADINITDSDGQTALLYAVKQSNNESVVRALIDAGADVNKTALFGQTALFQAVQQSNNESVVQTLVKSGADVNKIDKEDQTALFYAVKQSNNENVVRALIGSGADVNITDSDGQTASFYAVRQSNNENVIRGLIESGADVNKSDEDGQTALFYAVRQSNNENVIRALIESGADVNKCDENGQNALFYAVQQSNNENVIRALIESGADVNKSDEDGQTALFYAVKQNNNENVVRALIDAGADVNQSDNNAQTALFYAVNEGIIGTLIEEGKAFVNERDRYGRTALFYAMKNLDLSRVRYLIEKGGNLHVKDFKNVSTFSIFIENRITDDRNVMTLFASDIFHGQQGRDNLNNAILDIFFCHTPLLSISAGLFSSSKSHIICKKKRLIEAMTLSQYYIPDAEDEAVSRCINISRMTGEYKNDLPQLLAKLNQLGANPNSADSDGNTALHYATLLPLFGVTQNINMDICEKLRHLGAIVDVKNHQNETPLLFSLSTYNSMKFIGRNDQRQAIRGLTEVCRLLLRRGSSADEPSQSGESVFHLMIHIIKKILELHDESSRQGVLEEAIQLFELFSTAKVVKRKVVVNKRDINLNSPLHLWASLSLTSPQDYTRSVATNLTFQRFLQMVFNQLFECGAKVNDRNENNETPLHLCKTWSAVKILIEAGANPNDVDSSGRLPLLVAAKNRTFLRKLDFFYPDVSEDAKPYWDRIVAMGLDPWTADNHGETVLSILIQSDAFVLAKALVDVACEQNYTQSEAFAVCLLNTICKDKSTLTNWKTVLVEEILKSRKCPTTATAPLRLCCKNIIETGVFDDKLADKTDSPIRTPISEDYEPSPAKKRRMDKTISEDEARTDSVHCAILKVLRLYGADGESCLDIAESCPPLKDLLVRSIDIETVHLFIPWISFSKKSQYKLAKVARRRECDVVNQFWLHKDPIGSGSFGDVFAGINEKDGREVAIKRILKSRLHRPEDKREITNLTALADCKQIVRYLLFFEDEKFSYVVLELMEGNLDEYLDDSTFGKGNNTPLCEDVVKGLKYLHEQNILHRDLKPGNILYKTDPKLCLKIADFGLSRRIESTGCTTVYGTNAGTRRWIAPEVLMCTQDNSKSSDVFSCGLLLHYILSVKKHPFSKDNRQVAHEIETNITKGKMEGWDDSLSPEATHLLKNMLEKDEKKRITASKALDHPLFWSPKKKIDLLVAVGNQPVFEYPRARKSTNLTPVVADLEKSFSTIVSHGKWNDPRYLHMPAIYAEMTKKRKLYDTSSAVELVRLTRNAYALVSEDKRSIIIRKLLLKDFVFLDYFPHLVMEVYKVVTTHQWNQTRDEIKYAMNK